ncbi:MAG: HEAT repeat domain-containing protein, partial [Bryobacteraceae bacterium]
MKLNESRVTQAEAQRPATPAPKRASPSPEIPPEFQAAAILELPEAALIKILEDPQATVFQKAKACQRLATIGTGRAVPALAALLADPQLSHYARFGLEPNPDPAAAEALRTALRKVKGNLLVGVINSIGARRDPQAVDALARLVGTTDPAAAQAAAAALGRIGGLRAARILEDALRRTRGEVRSTLAAACLVCAESLLAQGERERGMALYQRLMRPDIPKP